MGFQGRQRNVGDRSKVLSPQRSLLLGGCPLKPGGMWQQRAAHPMPSGSAGDQLCRSPVLPRPPRESQEPGLLRQVPVTRSTSFSPHDFYFQVKLCLKCSGWGTVINFNCFHVSKQQKLGLISPVTPYYIL